MSAEYGQVANFSREDIIEYPDFKLKFTGRTFNKYDHTFYTFAIWDVTQTIEFNGSNVKAYFVIGDKYFLMEMAFAEAIGTLKPDEIVITRLNIID